MSASRHGEIDTVQNLLSLSNVDTQVSGGWIALHWVCMHSYVEIVRLLLSVFARIDISNDQRLTPTMVAETAGHTHVLHYLRLTLTESPALAVPACDNNNSVSISVTSVNDVSKVNNNKNNKKHNTNNAKYINRPVKNGKRSSIKIV
jgi:ankyrin repeat protein